jgi:hypothetical protein
LRQDAARSEARDKITSAMFEMWIARLRQLDGAVYACVLSDAGTRARE